MLKNGVNDTFWAQARALPGHDWVFDLGIYLKKYCLLG
jgi:hypothetical protein